MAKKNKASGGVATAKKPAGKKPPTVGGKPVKKKTAPKTGGTKGDFAPDQKPLTSMEDVDERIPELEELCQGVIAHREKRTSLKSDIEEFLEEIEDQLISNKLECYICNGKKFYIEPGCPSVKVVKVKQQG